MGEGCAAEPIRDDELLLRRIPTSTQWYQPQEHVVYEDAFLPTKADDDGLSLMRAEFCPPEEFAAKGRQGKQYYVAQLRAADIRAQGIDLKADPQPDNPGHALLPQMTRDNRKDDQTLERARILARLVTKVSGPFSGRATG